MDNWSKDDLLRLDSIYAKAGVPFHARPLHAAMDLLGQGFTLGGDDSRIRSITQAYKKLIPEVDTIWPGKGIGFAASVDRVHKVTVAVVFGSQAITTDKALGFDSSKEWIATITKLSQIAALLLQIFMISPMVSMNCSDLILWRLNTGAWPYPISKT